MVWGWLMQWQQQKVISQWLKQKIWFWVALVRTLSSFQLVGFFVIVWDHVNLVYPRPPVDCLWEPLFHRDVCYFGGGRSMRVAALFGKKSAHLAWNYEHISFLKWPFVWLLQCTWELCYWYKRGFTGAGMYAVLWQHWVVIKALQPKMLAGMVCMLGSQCGYPKAMQQVLFAPSHFL